MHFMPGQTSAILVVRWEGRKCQPKVETGVKLSLSLLCCQIPMRDGYTPRLVCI